MNVPVDAVEAAALLRSHLDGLASWSRAALVALVGDQHVATVIGGSGTEYQIEVEALWDRDPGGMLRVQGAIDDGRFRSAFRPVTDEFLIGEDGSIIR